jgi:octaprenyl-diphosphate synthase
LYHTLIFNLIKSKVELIPEISSHTISSGGKRLRPILTLACAQMCGYSGTSHIELAASVEFIHTATLLHDDVVDKSSLRRGTLTANSLWGNKESILVGDFLLGKAFELMGAAESLEVYKVLSNAAVVISEGEVKQLAVTGKLDITMDEYFGVINAKTAELFAAACQVSGVIAQRSNAEIAALRQYGMSLGTAFQIIDDVLDYSADQAHLGKNIGDDFREKKITLPVIIAYANANAAEKAFWQECFAKDTEYTQEALDKAIRLIKANGGAEGAISTAVEIAEAASRSLEIFDNTPMRQVLVDILGFVVGRDF